MYSFLAALTFLTIIPIPNHLLEKCKFDGCQKYFPLIGLIIGTIISLLCYLLFLILPGMVAAALSTVAMIKITGGLHLDGLSDTADGFYSHRDREQTKVIMKDSCIGSFGSIAQICLILLKTSAIYELSGRAFLAVFLAPIVGRTAILFVSHTVKPASKSGLGFSINSSTDKLSLIFGIVISLIIAIILFKLLGILSVILALATTLLLAKISEKKIGGYTGDILGASCEISEMMTLVVLSASMI